RHSGRRHSRSPGRKYDRQGSRSASLLLRIGKSIHEGHEGHEEHKVRSKGKGGRDRAASVRISVFLVLFLRFVFFVSFVVCPIELLPCLAVAIEVPEGIA